MSYLSNVDWSSILACLALALSIWTYIKHDKKIREQEKLLNEYHLNKILEEKEGQQKAQIKANSLKGSGGNNILKVYNAGRGKAERVTIIYECDDVYLLNAEIFPYELLNPQDYIDVNFVTTYASPDKLKITLCWDDEFKAGNKFTQFITL